MAERPHACQLYLAVETAEGAADRLAAALAAVEAASVLITSTGAALDAATAGPLVAIAQRAGAAAVIAGDARLARTLKADGVHLAHARDAVAAYTEARGMVGSGGIVGADPGISRHDAMTLAEAGADYIAFGAPGHLKDGGKARARRDELIAWWAEIFEVPCVAFDVEGAEEARSLAAAGADFIGVRLPAGESPAAARQRVETVAAALGLATPVA